MVPEHLIVTKSKEVLKNQKDKSMSKEYGRIAINRQQNSVVLSTQ